MKGGTGGHSRPPRHCRGARQSCCPEGDRLQRGVQKAARGRQGGQRGSPPANTNSAAGRGSPVPARGPRSDQAGTGVPSQGHSVGMMHAGTHAPTQAHTHAHRGTRVHTHARTLAHNAHTGTFTHARSHTCCCVSRVAGRHAEGPPGRQVGKVTPRWVDGATPLEPTQGALA